MKIDIAIIVAITENGVIGSNNGMPWRIAEDAKRFKKITLGKPVIMGRKTHESIGRKLPYRPNIILTRKRNYVARSCSVVHSVREALSAACKGAEKHGESEAIVIGGASIYDQFLPLTDRIYLTRIHDEIPGDVHFDFDQDKWQVVEKEKREPQNKSFTYSFLILERK